MLTGPGFSSYLEKLSTLFMTVGRTAPCYQDMALLYPRSKRLPSLLSEYFIVVVRLCHQVLRFVKQPILGLLMSPLSGPDLKTYQSDFERWAGSIKDEVTLLMAQRLKEQGSQMRILSAFSQSESRRKHFKTYHRILESCSTYDHQATWKEIGRAGNASLFVSVPEYKDWKPRMDSCTLVCTGKLGSGKSVLLANMVDDLHLQSEKLPVAYFFCRHDVSKSLEARTIIGSLAWQLLQTTEATSVVKCFTDTGPLMLDVEGMFRLLRSAVPPRYRAYIILDGLDECDRHQRQDVIGFLQQLQHLFPLLACLSFTLEADSVSKLRLDQFVDPSQFSLSEDNLDISNFIILALESTSNPVN